MAISKWHESHRSDFSISQWARRLGYRSPQTLSMVLSGARVASYELIERLCEDLNLEPDERRYLVLLLRLEKKLARGASTADVIAELEALNPKFGAVTEYSFDTFAYISDWYFLPLKQLIASQNPREDYEAIAAVLGNKISQDKLRRAVDILIRLGLAKRDKRRRRLVGTGGSFNMHPKVPSEIVRLHHKQMIQRGLESIDEQVLGEREMMGLCLSMDKNRLPEAKEMLKSFLNKFNETFHADKGDEVYQLNLQLFSHTSRKDD